MTDPVSPEWLTNAVADAKVEWFAEYSIHNLPEPTEREQQIFRLGFASGVDAGIRRVMETVMEED